MASTAIINQHNLENTGLFQRWSCAAFNHLKNIHDSHKVHLDDVVNDIAIYLNQSDLYEFIGISRSHNHFILKPDELVLMSLSSSVEDCLAKVDSDASIAYLTPTSIKSMATPSIPYMWAYSRDNHQFFPVQFFDGTNSTMQRRFFKLCNEKREVFLQFLDKFIELTEKARCEEYLGFYIRYEDLIKHNKDKGDGMMEETNMRERRQWMLPYAKENLQAIIDENRKMDPNFDLTATHWFFNDKFTSNENVCKHICTHICKWH
ncbi:unnamed protein product [Rotaria socialis]|uniref:Uncharacterized protein n=1 Tax=Rotaria socialis TaxID=392032 RepID=A0A817ZN16_9BILA|nr:unnamed protein product [Rotaria socialis]CAF4578153.1 unnamed protein product [Rotaria socialis]